MIRYNVNTCDQTCDELQVHFTKFCPNHCPFCIDRFNTGVGYRRPDVGMIFMRISEYAEKVSGIGISGGEPMVYMDELMTLVSLVKRQYPRLKINIISSIPPICAERKDDFFKILSMIDTFAFSPQHHDEDIADKIRGVVSGFDRQALYREIAERYADKTTVNINAFRPYLCTKDDIIKCVLHYNRLGFRHIKLSEMFDRDDMFVNIEETLGLKGMKSPFAHGCSVRNYDTSEIMPEFNGDLTLKRVCFLKTRHRHAGIADIGKNGDEMDVSEAVCIRRGLRGWHDFALLDVILT